MKAIMPMNNYSTEQAPIEIKAIVCTNHRAKF